MEAGHIKFVLLQKIGKAALDHHRITEEEILAAIDEN